MITEPGSPWPQAARLDRLRRDRGLLTPGELLDLADRGVTVLDPFSVIVSRGVLLRPGTVLYPGVVIECDPQSGCALGRDNVLYGGTRIAATGGGNVTVGRGCQIGDGGARIVAARTDALRIGDGVRLCDGAEVTGSSRLGAGSQVLGRISARSVQLADGQPHTHPDPDHRGGVLKGFGRAIGVRVGVGEVINAAGDFRTAAVERQRTYHPDAPRC